MKYIISVLIVFLIAVSCAEKKDTLLNTTFKDTFDKQLDEGWFWLREDPNTWRLKDNALEIMIEPGKANSVKNALVRKAPDRGSGTFAIDVTVTNHTLPIQQYEQVGITWYSDGKPVFKLVKEFIDGELYIIPGKVPMPAKTVQLRLVVADTSWTAQFRPHAEGRFQTAARGTLPLPGKDQVSIQCYNGPTSAKHWIKFDDFQISKLGDGE